MKLCNSCIPEEHFVCYQTSQHNRVIIKMIYRCLRWCLLSWHRSRLGFVTPCIWEVSLGPLGNAHHSSLASLATNKLVAGWCITERVKRLAGNEIEQGIGIPTTESRASTIPLDKGNCIRDWLSPWHRGSSDEIIVEHVGADMGIYIPLLVIDQRTSRSCLHGSRTRRVYTLKVRWR